MMKKKRYAQTTESSWPVYTVKDLYLAEYYDLVTFYRECARQRLRGVSQEIIEKSKKYNYLLAALLSLGEKLRRKLENKDDNGKKGTYASFLYYIGRMSKGEKIKYSEAVSCINTITNFFEDAGYTNFDRQFTPPESAVDEWE